MNGVDEFDCGLVLVVDSVSTQSVPAVTSAGQIGGIGTTLNAASWRVLS